MTYNVFSGTLNPTQSIRFLAGSTRLTQVDFYNGHKTVIFYYLVVLVVFYATI